MTTTPVPNYLINADEELERSVLGSALALPDLLASMLRILPKANAFYLKKHQYLYMALSTLYAERVEIDLFSVSNYLKLHKLLDQLPQYELMDIMQYGVPGNFEGKCRILFELALRRYLFQYSAKLSQISLDPSVDPLTLVSSVQEDLNQIMGQLLIQQEKGPGDYLSEVLTDLEERNQGIRHGLTTGIPILDNRIGGFQPGNFVILAARPSTGKSAMLVHWLLHHTLELQQGAGLFTLEMTGKEVMSRTLAYQTGYSNFQLQQDDKLNLGYIHQHLGGLPTMPLRIWQRSIQLPELLNTAREWHRRDGISLVAVDFIQLVRDSRYSKPLDRVTEVSTSLKALAQDTGMVVVGLSQLSRECEKRSGWDRRPVLSDLRDSGSLEQDANSVLMLFSPHRNNLRYDDGSSDEHTLEIHALKLRNGKPTQPGPDPGDNGPLVVNYDAAVNQILSRLDRPGQAAPVTF